MLIDDYDPATLHLIQENTINLIFPNNFCILVCYSSQLWTLCTLYNVSFCHYSLPVSTNILSQFVMHAMCHSSKMMMMMMVTNCFFELLISFNFKTLWNETKSYRNCHTVSGWGEHELGWNENGTRCARQRNQRNRTFDGTWGVLWNSLLLVGLEEWFGNQFASWCAQLSIHVCLATYVAVIVWRWMGSCSIYDQSDIGPTMEIWPRCQNGFHGRFANRFECESTLEGICSLTKVNWLMIVFMMSSVAGTIQIGIRENILLFLLCIRAVVGSDNGTGNRLCVWPNYTDYGRNR